MATVKQYIQNLWTVQTTVARKLGVIVQGSPQETRVVVLTGDVMLAGLIKLLVDKAVMTDAELLSMFNSIAAADFPAQPFSVGAPGDGESYPPLNLG